MTNYTTTIEIPKDDTGDQRIYFTNNDEHSRDPKLLKIHKHEIQRIEDGAGFYMSNLDKAVLERFVKEHVKGDYSYYFSSGDDVHIIFAGKKTVKMSELIGDNYKMIYLKGTGLPNFITIHASAETIKTLEDYVFHVPNHKKI